MPSPIQPVADRFGWPQFVGTVAAVYHRLPPSEQAQTTILTGNYGEDGAIDLLGPTRPVCRVVNQNGRDTEGPHHALCHPFFTVSIGNSTPLASCNHTHTCMRFKTRSALSPLLSARSIVAWSWFAGQAS